ncbi:hypothetical protein K438DRAFT_1926126 [Mycena galopus ATCC 62051]|nr:hypothetical protein K438DRAFT_1926126 [Mycena galopus ATCC 62051]
MPPASFNSSRQLLEKFNGAYPYKVFEASRRALRMVAVLKTFSFSPSVKFSWWQVLSTQIALARWQMEGAVDLLFSEAVKGHLSVDLCPRHDFDRQKINSRMPRINFGVVKSVTRINYGVATSVMSWYNKDQWIYVRRTFELIGVGLIRLGAGLIRVMILEFIPMVVVPQILTILTTGLIAPVGRRLTKMEEGSREEPHSSK